jgi:hypothetical protein
MGELRNRLDRKNELRLYEWMKNGENYTKLRDKTVTEGAEAVSRELDLKVSGSVLTSIVQAMGLDPFWKVRQPAGKRVEGEQQQLADIKKGLEVSAQRLDQTAQAIENLKVVCTNIVRRLERVEEHEREHRGRARRMNNGPAHSQGELDN